MALRKHTPTGDLRQAGVTSLMRHTLEKGTGVDCDSWKWWKAGGRRIHAFDDANAAPQAGQAVAAGRCRRCGPQCAILLKGWSIAEMRAMEATRKQLRSPACGAS